MSGEPVATSDGPVKRRPSWNLKSIVEDVGGRPIADFQDPSRPTHPYVRDHLAHDAAVAAAPAPEPETIDPVGRIYPPLVGAAGRSWHGKDAEHHAETLASVPTHPTRPPGPNHRPERIYLHYLLLHLDRLNDTALTYLFHAVNEERQHRAAAAPEGPSPARSAPPPLPEPSAPAA